MRRAAVAMLASGLLAGCSTYVPQPIDPVATEVELDARRLDEPRLIEFLSRLDPRTAADAQAGRWELPALTVAALYYHPDLEIAKAKLAQAEGAVATAEELPNPTMTLSPTRHTAAYDPALTVGAAIAIVIDPLGARAVRGEQARNLVAVARAELGAAAWQVRGRVQSALLALWAATTRQRFIAQRRASQDQITAVYARRLEEGAASAPEIARQRSEVDQIVEAAAAAERDLVDARASLAAAIGIPVAAFDTVRIGFDAFEHPPSVAGAASLREKALRSRSDLRAALAAYAAAEAALHGEILRQYPDVTLGPAYDYDQGDNKYTLAVSAELPILNQHQGPIAQATAYRDEMAARFIAVQAQIIGEIDHAVARLGAADRAVAAAEILCAGEQRHRNRIDQIFHAGGTDRPTVLAADLAAAMIEQQRFDTVAEQRAALVALDVATQLPVFGPMPGLPADAP